MSNPCDRNLARLLDLLASPFGETRSNEAEQARLEWLARATHTTLAPGDDPIKQTVARLEAAKPAPPRRWFVLWLAALLGLLAALAVLLPPATREFLLISPCIEQEYKPREPASIQRRERMIDRQLRPADLHLTRRSLLQQITGRSDPKILEEFAALHRRHPDDPVWFSPSCYHRWSIS